MCSKELPLVPERDPRSKKSSDSCPEELEGLQDNSPSCGGLHSWTGFPVNRRIPVLRPPGNRIFRPVYRAISTLGNRPPRAYCF